MAILRLSRSKEFKSSIRDIKVIIDGWDAGYISDGQTKDFLIPEGSHNLKVTLDSICTSQVMAFNAHSDEVVCFFLYHKQGIALMNMLFDNTNYFILERR